MTNSRGRDFATFGFTCVRNKEHIFTTYSGYRTIFALNIDGSYDSQDNGVGATAYNSQCVSCKVLNMTASMMEDMNSYHYTYAKD